MSHTQTNSMKHSDTDRGERNEKKMKKGKIAMTITIGIACFALVTVMMMQFKVVNETDITAIEEMQESELKTELANWKTRYEEIDAQYQEVAQRIEEYKNDEESNNEASQLLQEELKQTNTLLGLTDVHGEGLIITLKSGEDITPITADDLLVIVNALKFAGAEAISINDERIVNTTDIVYITSGSFIRVNGQRILEPYVIKVIGNQSHMESAVTGTGGKVEELQTLGHTATIEKDNDITIGKYNGEIETRYIQ